MASGNRMQNGVHLASGRSVKIGGKMANGAPLENGDSVAPSDGAGDAEKSPLRHLHDTQVSLEKFRIQLKNRLSAITRGADEQEKPVPAEYARVLALASEMEAEIDHAIAREVAHWPVYEAWLRHVKGIGPGLAGQMLSLLLPPKPEYGPSSWFKAAGLTATVQPDGLSRLPRDRKDSPATHHRWLRRCLYNVGDSFIKNGGYYREVFDSAKRRLFRLHAPQAEAMLAGWERSGDRGRYITDAHGLEEIYERWVLVLVIKGVTRDEWRAWIERGGGSHDALLSAKWKYELETPTMAKAFYLVGAAEDTPWPMHRIDSAARWIMVKRFLSSLWQMWCEADHIPNRGPYGLTVLADGRKVLRFYNSDGSYVEHAYEDAPRWNGKDKI